MNANTKLFFAVAIGFALLCAAYLFGGIYQ